MKVVTGAEMRNIETQMEQHGTPVAKLAERAGGALADAVLKNWPDRPALILAGPGNNGGDGIIAARYLQSSGIESAVFTLARSLSPEEGIATVRGDDGDGMNALHAALARGPVVLDCLLGTGASRPPQGRMADVISAVNAAKVPVIAADIPTGVNPDTGAMSGVAVRATMTLALGFAKVGDVVYPGAGHAGKLEVAPLGIPRSLAAHIRLAVTGRDEAASMLPQRPADSNKGTYGRVLVAGGSRDYPSAPGLTSIAALRTGAGLAEAAVLPLSQQVIAAHALEPIYLLMPEDDGHVSAGSSSTLAAGLGGVDCLVAGPGLGRSDAAVSLIHDILAFPRDTFSGPMLIDADGLNALSRLDDWWKLRDDLVLTPHPGEMARLTGLTIDQIQADRIGVARTYAARWNAVVVLKGAGTVVARPDGEARINPTGGPNLATGGTGDVLSGIIGGLLVQGADRWSAAVAGTYLHGLAGDRLAQRHGDSGTLAGDLLSEIPLARRALLDGGDDS